MKRRLYFLLPLRTDAERLIDDLAAQGQSRSHVHCMDRHSLGDRIPESVRLWRRRDRGLWLEWLVWNSNLTVFGLAFVGLVVSLSWGFNYGSVAAIAVMLITFFLGERFAAKMPRVHLNEFHDALRHGEVLLMVDVAPGQVAQMEDFIHRRHPEAAVGGVGWTAEAIRI